MKKLNPRQWHKRALFVATSAFVLSATVPATTAQTSEMDEARAGVSVPQGDLSDSLFALSTQLGVTIVAPNELVDGLAAPAIDGQMSAEQALAELLSGSGLVAETSNGSGYTIVEATPKTDAQPASPAATTSQPTVSEPEDEERVENTIIVTGTKLGLSLQETVDSVELLTAERLENDAVFQLSDAIARTPNASVIGGAITNINIRGINRNGTGGAGQGQAINIFLDGTPLSANAILSSDSIWDVNQVEILRGSQSILQGRNSIAGAVVLTANDPSYDWEGAGRVRLGEFGERQYSAVVSGPIIKDQVAFRLSGDFDQTDGIITNAISGEDDNNQDNLTLRGKLLLEPEALKDLRVELTMEYTESELARVTPSVVGGEGPAGEGNLSPARIQRLASFDPNERLTFSDFAVAADIETKKFIGDVTYDFTDNLSLDFVGTYEKTDRINNNFLIEQNPFGDVGTFSETESEIYSGDIRLNFDFDKLTGLIGGYYFDSETAGDTSATQLIPTSPFPIDPEGSILTFTGTTSDKTENTALYTAWRYSPTEKWDFDAGLRYDEETFSAQNVVNGFFVAPDTCSLTVPGAAFGLPFPVITISCTQGVGLLVPPSNPIEADSFDVLLPSGALTYNIDEDKSVFVGARRGYRAGGTFIAQSLQDASNIFNVLTFDPEFLDTFEAGWRSQWLDGRLTFNGTAYYSQYKDQQVRFTDEFGFTITDNAGETTLFGLELSFDYSASDNWDIYGSLALKDTEFDEFLFQEDDPDTAIDETIDLAGNELDRAENVSFTLGTSYVHDNGLFGSAAVSYKSSYFSDIFNLDESVLPGGLTEKIDGAAVVNGRIGYRWDGGNISLVGQNLFDEDTPEIVNFASSGILNGSAGLGNEASATVRQPRTVSVVLSVEF
ncbi:MAG: TonB-dependent receptor [Henriciella sp.]